MVSFFFPCNLCKSKISNHYSYTQKTILLNQQNVGWFNHRIYLLYEQQNICLIQTNCFVVLTKSEYLVDLTK